jgi:hypothetical protein
MFSGVLSTSRRISVSGEPALMRMSPVMRATSTEGSRGPS